MENTVLQPTKMKNRIVVGFISIFCLHCVLPISAQNWPQWRGPDDTVTARWGNPPIEWNEKKNIKWKTKLRGTDHSTPVVWRDTVFLTAALPTGDELTSNNGVKTADPIQFLVMAVDRHTGKLKWEKAAVETISHGPRHPTGAWAAASPVTDGNQVYSFFGKRSLLCFQRLNNPDTTFQIKVIITL